MGQNTLGHYLDVLDALMSCAMLEVEAGLGLSVKVVASCFLRATS